MFRVLISVGWVVGSILAWWCVLFAIGLGAEYLTNERQVRLPDWFDPFFNEVLSFGGTVLIPAFVALLVVRGKLPGTAAISKSTS